MRLSDLVCDSISEALGHDPLLIALHEPNHQPQAERVIEEFINSSVARLAIEHAEYTAGDYRTALRSMAAAMLSHRALSPSWPAVKSWLTNENDVTGMLRHLVHHGEIVRLSGAATVEHLIFRHDRIRDALFSEAIAVGMRTDELENNLLAEPYFAEVIGAALLDDGIPATVIDRVLASNPLALFCAFRTFREPLKPIHHAILGAIDLWLSDPETHGPQNSHLRWEALAELSRTESSRVVAIVRKFQEMPAIAWEALFRNGDLTGGINICLAAEPGVGAIWRDRQIEHAKLRFDSNLRSVIDPLLRQDGLDEKVRVGLLRMVGYLADPRLAEVIEASWNIDAARGAHLGDYLWAFAQCCGNDSERFLGPVCDVWAALPSEQNDNMPSPRDDLAAHSLKWAFSKDVPESAITYFIKRANSDDLRWPITYMLNGVDHPDAVEFVVRELAEISRRLEGTEGFSPFVSIAADEWQRRQEGERSMSPKSRDRLLGLWQNQANDKHIRRNAFRFWAATEDSRDLEILQSVDASDLLADSALQERLRRRDSKATSGLLLKLKDAAERRAFWWHFAHLVWSADLARALQEEFDAREASIARTWGASFPTDSVIYQTITLLSG